MLSNDLLSQLTQLKKDIRASKDIAQGLVRGTSGRYGFVTLDDGRDAFLNPDQMERVFPGDRVEVEVTQNEKEQHEASLKKLIHSPLSHLAGRYRVRGKGHFIATDVSNITRWVFIPPKNRANCEDGHYVTAKIIRHPFKDGRAQAKITKNIGGEDTCRIERLYTLGKYQLSETFSAAEIKESKQLLAAQKDSSPPESAHTIQRQDLKHVPFVTIDSAATRDMDDALAVEATDTGWILSVAIANPGADIAQDSLLDKAAKRRGQTIYFPGKPLPMLPETLSLENYSLKSGAERPSLICQCHIDHNGHINDFSFIPAIIQPQAKLSYTQVAALLEERSFDTPQNLDNATPFKPQLEELQNCTQALYHYRQQHHLVIDSKPDFALYLDDKGKLSSIEKIERNCAHRIVEEAMLATNRCAGEFLAHHNTGLHNTHRGYRPERRQDIEALLSEKTGHTVADTDRLENYMAIIKQLQGDDTYLPLLSIQQRFLEAGQMSKVPTPHFGLGFQHYATVTSPIRRYQDLHNQRVIHQLLAGQPPSQLEDDQLEALKLTINDNRSASQFMEQWLICDYLKNKIGQTFHGTISLLTNQGVGIRLDNTGIEGFIPAVRANKKDPDAKGDKISFNNQRMELLWNDKPIFLDQAVAVTLAKIDNAKKKLEFCWAEA